jgi:hypothetical membrane protein
MKYENRKIAGSLLFIGAVLCVLGIIIAEALYPGYSTSGNYISDLGVGPSSLIFNSSLFLLGVLTVGGAYFIQRASDFRLFSILAAITGIGAMGVGLFTEDAGVVRLGKGGMERMIAYPALLWAIGFGGHLISYSSESSTAKKP